MQSSPNTNAVKLRDQTHLEQLCHKRETFLVLVYSDKCKPCKRLKPPLFEKATLHDINMFTIHVDKKNHTSLMKKLEVEKVPHVSCFHTGEYKGSIQNSDITVTWPFVEKYIHTFELNSDF